MIVSRFIIGTDYTPPERWFWVRIYDSVESLRKVANRVSEMRGGRGQEYDDCLGCVQEVAPLINADLHDPADMDYLPQSALHWPENGFAGVIRFSKDWLTTEIISHEVTHAALVMFRMNIAMRPRLEGMAPDVGGLRMNEEALAYAVGQLTEAVHERLYQHGFA